MKQVDTFFIRQHVLPGQNIQAVAREAVLDLRQAAREMGLTLKTEPQARHIPDGAYPQVEAWAHIPPRITKPKPPVFFTPAEYLSWRHSEQAAA